MRDLEDDILDNEKLKKVLFKIGYNGFWIIFFLRFVGITYAIYLFNNQRYIFGALLFIISLPSFEYTMVYIKHIKKLFHNAKET